MDLNNENILYRVERRPDYLPFWPTIGIEVEFLLPDSISPEEMSRLFGVKVLEELVGFEGGFYEFDMNTCKHETEGILDDGIQVYEIPLPWSYKPTGQEWQLGYIRDTFIGRANTDPVESQPGMTSLHFNFQPPEDVDTKVLERYRPDLELFATYIQLAYGTRTKMINKPICDLIRINPSAKRCTKTGSSATESNSNPTRLEIVTGEWTEDMMDGGIEEVHLLIAAFFESITEESYSREWSSFIEDIRKIIIEEAKIEPEYLYLEKIQNNNRAENFRASEYNGDDHLNPMLKRTLRDIGQKYREELECRYFTPREVVEYIA